MPNYTENYDLEKPIKLTENASIDVINNNMEKIDTNMKKISDKNKMVTATGTGTTIIVTVTDFELVDGAPITFVASVSSSASKTINVNGTGAKSAYKPNTTTAPNIVAGKAYTFWYDEGSDCFFIKASAEGTATADKVLAPYTISNDEDTGIVGTMPDNGAVDVTLTSEGQEYTVGLGFHNGLGKIIVAITNLIASVIKYNVTVGGILGSFTGDGTTVAGHILAGKIAYSKGVRYVGTILSKAAATITPGTTDQTISAGQYLSGDQTIASLGGNAPQSAVLDTYTFSSNTAGRAKAGTIPSKASATITPGVANQTIASGQYLSGDQTIASLGGNAPQSAVLDSYTFSSNVAGRAKSGTIPSKATASYSPGASPQTISAGQYLAGTQTIEAVDGLSDDVVKKDQIVGGVTGSFGGYFDDAALNAQITAQDAGTAQATMTKVVGVTGAGWLNSVVNNVITTRGFKVKIDGTWFVGSDTTVFDAFEMMAVPLFARFESSLEVWVEGTTYLSVYYSIGDTLEESVPYAYSSGDNTLTTRVSVSGSGWVYGYSSATYYTDAELIIDGVSVFNNLGANSKASHFFKFRFSSSMVFKTDNSVYSLNYAMD